MSTKSRSSSDASSPKTLSTTRQVQKAKDALDEDLVALDVKIDKMINDGKALKDAGHLEPEAAATISLLEAWKNKQFSPSESTSSTVTLRFFIKNSVSFIVFINRLILKGLEASVATVGMRL